MGWPARSSTRLARISTRLGKDAQLLGLFGALRHFDPDLALRVELR